jgi:patatin-like phospholipase
LLYVGGIIALALAYPSKKKLSEMTNFFHTTSKTVFSDPRLNGGKLLRKLDPQNIRSGLLLGIKVFDSIFKTTHLRNAMKTFFGQSVSLFSPATTLGESSTTRVAVTSTTDRGTTEYLITNYNRPQLGRTNGNHESHGSRVDSIYSLEIQDNAFDRDENFHREDSDKKDIKIWEAALATSAAPLYFRPFMHENTQTEHVDGALWANCPARVALTEMSRLWPTQAASLDILVSLSSGKQTKKPGWIPDALKFKGFDEIVECFHRLLDTQDRWRSIWESFHGLDEQSRLHRLDPPISGAHVALYHYDRMEDLMKDVAGWATGDGYSRIHTVSKILMASLFFFEPDAESSPTDPNYETMGGEIRCRLKHADYNSSNIGDLSKLLQKIEGFQYSVCRTSSLAELEHVENHAQDSWSTIWEHKANSTSIFTYEDGKRKFRLRHIIQIRRGDDLRPVIALKFKDVNQRFPISGFPASLREMRKRAELTYLQ